MYQIKYFEIALNAKKETFNCFLFVIYLQVNPIIVGKLSSGCGVIQSCCGEMIQWLWGDPIIALWGNDLMVVG